MTIMTNDSVILRTNDQKNRPRDFHPVIFKWK